MGMEWYRFDWKWEECCGSTRMDCRDCHRFDPSLFDLSLNVQSSAKSAKI